MPNNVVREQQLQSVASAAKDFMLAKANILSSVPATVNGGLWYYMRYEFSANTEAEDYEIGCTVNGYPMEVVEVNAGEFYAKLTEFGALAIMIPQS